ncbi:MAG: hypothetical protein NTZ80_01650 [Patescibacteria group bacterium]|nr:hypothetical protein [Patescibacteria group bacterium]
MRIRLSEIYIVIVIAILSLTCIAQKGLASAGKSANYVLDFGNTVEQANSNTSNNYILNNNAVAISTVGTSSNYQLNPATSTAYCGNGIKENSEACDNQNFGGKTCINYGYDSGNLVCQNCVISVSSCYNSGLPTSNDAGNTGYRQRGDDTKPPVVNPEKDEGSSADAKGNDGDLIPDAGKDSCAEKITVENNEATADHEESINESLGVAPLIVHQESPKAQESWFANDTWSKNIESKQAQPKSSGLSIDGKEQMNYLLADVSQFNVGLISILASTFALSVALTLAVVFNKLKKHPKTNAKK